MSSQDLAASAISFVKKLSVVGPRRLSENVGLVFAPLHSASENLYHPASLSNQICVQVAEILDQFNLCTTGILAIYSYYDTWNNSFNSAYGVHSAH